MLDYNVDFVGLVHDGHGGDLGLVGDLGHLLGLAIVGHALLGVVHVGLLVYVGFHVQIFF